MKKTYLFAGFTLVATLIMLVLSLVDFLALHDIRHEYVSKEILRSLGIGLSSELPAWTATVREWALVQFSYLERSAFLVLNAITLCLCVAVLRRQFRGGTRVT